MALPMACPGLPSPAAKRVRFGTVRIREFPTRYPNTVFLPIAASKLTLSNSQPLPSGSIKVVNGVGIPQISEEKSQSATTDALLEAYRQFLLTQPKPELQHSLFRFCEMMSDKNIKTQTFFSMRDPESPLLPTYTNTPRCSKCGWRHAKTDKGPTRCFTAKSFIDSSLPSATPGRTPGSQQQSSARKDSLQPTTSSASENTLSSITLRTTSHHILTVGTDCSGIEAPVQALLRRAGKDCGAEQQERREGLRLHLLHGP